MVEQARRAVRRLASGWTTLVEFSCQILARTRPIHAIIRGAADKEAFAATLERRMLKERLTAQTERIRRYLGEALRPELSIAEAGERYCALASPELYHLLTVDLSWTADQHQAMAHPTAANRTARDTAWGGRNTTLTRGVPSSTRHREDRQWD